MQYHVIIHKLTDLDIEESKEKLSEIESYVKLHPTTILVDPFSSVRKITSRERACECLQNALNRLTQPHPYKVPAYCIINDLAMASEEIRKGGICYPVICKPVNACGTAESHQMVSYFWLCIDIHTISMNGRFY